MKELFNSSNIEDRILGIRMLTLEFINDNFIKLGSIKVYDVILIPEIYVIYTPIGGFWLNHSCIFFYEHFMIIATKREKFLDFR